MASRDWLLDLAKSTLQDGDCEAACKKKVEEHRKKGASASELLPFQEIDASENRLGWRGCTAIVDIALQCKDLRVVKLFKNELTDEAAPAICRLVKDCRQLEQLHLTYNRFTAKAALEIISAANEGRGASRSEKGGITLWLRLEHNRIQRSDKLLEDLTAKRVDFCEAKDSKTCGPRLCKRCALVHLPYLAKQDAPGDDPSASSAAKAGGEEAARKRPQEEEKGEKKKERKHKKEGKEGKEKGEKKRKMACLSSERSEGSDRSRKKRKKEKKEAKEAKASAAPAMASPPVVSPSLSPPAARKAPEAERPPAEKPASKAAAMMFLPVKVKQKLAAAAAAVPTSEEAPAGSGTAASDAAAPAVAKPKPKPLVDIAAIQKQLEDERAKLRLWIVKAKTDYEERQERILRGQEARGVTNDEEYYICKEGEVFGPNSEMCCEGSIGRGVFSSVFKCKRKGIEVAVKFVRSNAMMTKAAEKEVETYRRLKKEAALKDAEAAEYIMWLAEPETFFHQGHLCMVFALQRCDLREALKKYGQGRGLPLQTVVQYSRQVFLALRLLRQLGIIHADLKPDNLLMSQNKTEIKVCDFGSAFSIKEQVNTPYLQPRYYRAPEVIIGMTYDTQIDMWSASATLFELGTGKILFTGRSNNLMLRQMLEVCGAMPKKVAVSGSCSGKHFNKEGDFLLKDADSLTGLPEVMPMTRFVKPPKPVQAMLNNVLKEPPPNADTRTQERLLPRLGDLVARCLLLDPSARLLPEQALEHDFYKKDR